MKKFLLLLLTLIISQSARSQVFQVDTLQYSGDALTRINFVIMGDGYTAAEQTTFVADAGALMSYLFTQAPWSSYQNYCNVFAIEVISAQSGARHPNTATDCPVSPSVPVSNPNTYFGCTFDYAGIHRLIVPTNVSAVTSVLAANMPSYDQVFILAHTPYYGGSGGAYATGTTHTSSNEVMAHEVGHSFAGLADEYYAGDSYAFEHVNMTQETDPALVRWTNWLGINNIGIYQYCCSGNSALWYKPSTSCKMQSLNHAYCSVCQQAIVEKIHALTSPLVSYTPAQLTMSVSSQLIPFKLTELILPFPNSLQITWSLDGNPLSSTTDSLQLDASQLTSGSHQLTAAVVDTSPYLLVNNHASIHVSTVTWNISKTTSGITTTSQDNKISVHVYPNPSSDLISIETEVQKPEALSIKLMSHDGKLIRIIKDRSLIESAFTETQDISTLEAGAYLLVFNFSGYIHTESFIKP